MCKKIYATKISRAKNTQKRNSLLKIEDAALGKSPIIREFNLDEPEDTKYVLFCSFIEIYNEKVYDLLQVPGKNGERTDLRIRQDMNGPFVDKTTEIPVRSTQEAYKVINWGHKNLQVAQTRTNKDSSRSHCIFTLKMCKLVDEKKGRWLVNSIAFCDLAGSERSTGMNSKRFAESTNINKSLSQLGIVIRELKQNQARPGKVAISYRASKLTRLMQTYFTGNSQTTIVVAVNQDPTQQDETTNSLKFAADAQKVALGRNRFGGKAAMTPNVSVVEPGCLGNVTPFTDSEEDDSEFEDYESWSKKDLIDDLKYYKDETENKQKCIMKMKYAWKEDEAKWNEHKKYYEELKEDNRIEIHNIYATNSNAKQVRKFSSLIIRVTILQN